MNFVPAFEAKTHLSNLLERVSQGEEFTILRHGKPVARLVPLEPARPAADPAAAVAALRAFARDRATAPGELRAWIEEGRRF